MGTSTTTHTFLQERAEIKENIESLKQKIMTLPEKKEVTQSAFVRMRGKMKKIMKKVTKYPREASQNELVKLEIQLSNLVKPILLTEMGMKSYHTLNQEEKQHALTLDKKYYPSVVKTRMNQPDKQIENWPLTPDQLKEQKSNQDDLPVQVFQINYLENLLKDAILPECLQDLNTENLEEFWNLYPAEMLQLFSKANQVKHAQQSEWKIFVEIKLDQNDFLMKNWTKWLKKKSKQFLKWSKADQVTTNESFAYDEEGRIIYQAFRFNRSESTVSKEDYLNLKEYIMEKPLLKSPTLRHGNEDLISEYLFLWNLYIEKKQFKTMNFEDFIKESECSEDLCSIDKTEPGLVERYPNKAIKYIKLNIHKYGFPLRFYINCSKYVHAWLRLLKTETHEEFKPANYMIDPLERLKWFSFAFDLSWDEFQAARQDKVVSTKYGPILIEAGTDWIFNFRKKLESSNVKYIWDLKSSNKIKTIPNLDGPDKFLVRLNGQYHPYEKTSFDQIYKNIRIAVSHRNLVHLESLMKDVLKIKSTPTINKLFNNIPIIQQACGLMDIYQNDSEDENENDSDDDDSDDENDSDDEDTKTDVNTSSTFTPIAFVRDNEFSDEDESDDDENYQIGIEEGYHTADRNGVKVSSKTTQTMIFGIYNSSWSSTDTTKIKKKILSKLKKKYGCNGGISKDYVYIGATNLESDKDDINHIITKLLKVNESDIKFTW